jgi:radical SAM protein with 4Fe4S-binding SPASM domain
MDYIPKYFEDNMPVSLGLEGFFNYEHPEDKVSCSFERGIPDESLSKVKMCAHVKTSLYISPSGQILPCFSMIGQPIENRMPNMFDTPLEDILNESLYSEIINYSCKDYFDHNPECNTCKYKNDCCGGCRAVAVRTSGEDYLGRDLRTCEYFLGGWKERKDEVLKKACIKGPQIGPRV